MKCYHHSTSDLRTNSLLSTPLVLTMHDRIVRPAGQM
jgi:hypothetical protein